MGRSRRTRSSTGSSSTSTLTDGSRTRTCLQEPVFRGCCKFWTTTTEEYSTVTVRFHSFFALLPFRTKHLLAYFLWFSLKFLQSCLRFDADERTELSSVCLLLRQAENAFSLSLDKKKEILRDLNWRNETMAASDSTASQSQGKESSHASEPPVSSKSMQQRSSKSVQDSSWVI